MTLQNTEALIGEIVEKRKAHLAAKIKAYPVNNFRASDIHECDRAMVHSVLDWDKKALHDEGLQAIFDAGNREEESVKNRLGYELGFQFAEQQRPFEIKNKAGEVICRGHIDGKIIYNGEAIPVEIKSMNQNLFNGIKSIDDFQKKPLHRKYLRQMQLYLFGTEQEAGLFILSDFRTEKLIPVVLDYGECEQILQRIERNWEFVKRKEYPKRIDYSDQLCGKCAYAHICLPEVKHAGAQFIDSPELIDKLTRRAELEPMADEYADLDKEIKEPFKQGRVPQVFVGTEWQIIGKEVVKNKLMTAQIPDEIKKQYTEQTTEWHTKIVHIPAKVSA